MGGGGGGGRVCLGLRHYIYPSHTEYTILRTNSIKRKREKYNLESITLLATIFVELFRIIH